MRKAGNDSYRPIDFKLNEILLFLVLPMSFINLVLDNAIFMIC
jgi:hypothetical protein